MQFSKAFVQDNANQYNIQAQSSQAPIFRSNSSHFVPQSYSQSPATNQAVPTTVMNVRSSNFTPGTKIQANLTDQKLSYTKDSIKHTFLDSQSIGNHAGIFQEATIQKPNTFHGRKNDSSDQAKFFYPQQPSQNGYHQGPQPSQSPQLNSMSKPFLATSSVPNFASINAQYHAAQPTSQFTNSNGRATSTSDEAGSGGGRTHQNSAGGGPGTLLSGADRIKMITLLSGSGSQRLQSQTPSMQSPEPASNMVSIDGRGSGMPHNYHGYAAQDYESQYYLDQERGAEYSRSKPAIAQVLSHYNNDATTDDYDDEYINGNEESGEDKAYNHIEFVNMSSNARKRRKPVPKRKLGYQTSDNGSRVSNEFSDGESRKTDSGSSFAEDKHSLFSGLKGENKTNKRNSGGSSTLNPHQNFSYSNFESFGGANSPNNLAQSENYPPPTKLLHSNSIQSNNNVLVRSPFDGQNTNTHQVFHQRSEFDKPMSANSLQTAQMWPRKNQYNGNNILRGDPSIKSNNWINQNQSGPSQRISASSRFNRDNKIAVTNSASSSSNYVNRHQISRESLENAPVQFYPTGASKEISPSKFQNANVSMSGHQQRVNGYGQQKCVTSTTNLYKVKKTSDQSSSSKPDHRQPLGEHSFGKLPSDQSLMSSSRGSAGPGSGANSSLNNSQVSGSKDVVGSSDKVAAGAKSGSAVATGQSDSSDKTSSQSSQPVVRRLKYEMCKNWREKGNCKYGDKCLFAHGEQELTKRSSMNGPEPAAPKTTPAASSVTTQKPAAASTTTKPDSEAEKLKTVETNTGASMAKDDAKSSEVKIEKAAKEREIASSETVTKTSLFVTPPKDQVKLVNEEAAQDSVVQHFGVITGQDQDEQILTPAFSTQERSTQISTEGRANTKSSNADDRLGTTVDHTFSGLSSLANGTPKVPINAAASGLHHEMDSHGSLTPCNGDDQKRLIEGDLNYLLDREIKQPTFVQRPVQVRKGVLTAPYGCNSTKDSSTNKSPLAAYGDMHSIDYQGGVTPTKHGSSISQRSSFDDSLNINDIMISSYGAQDNGNMRVEVSPGKIGDGLFPPSMLMMSENNIVDNNEEDLSSQEEDLIAQSSFEIHNFIKDKARPALLSRLAPVLASQKVEGNLSEDNTSKLSFSQDGDSSSVLAQNGSMAASRRLRIFQDITQRNAGKSNETCKVISQKQDLLD